MHYSVSTQKLLTVALLPFAIAVLPVHAQSSEKAEKPAKQEVKANAKQAKEESKKQAKEEKEKAKEKLEAKAHEGETSDERAAEKNAKAAQSHEKAIPEHEDHHKIGASKHVDKGFDFTNNGVQEMAPKANP